MRVETAAAYQLLAAAAAAPVSTLFDALRLPVTNGTALCTRFIVVTNGDQKPQPIDYFGLSSKFFFDFWDFLLF